MLAGLAGKAVVLHPAPAHHRATRRTNAAKTLLPPSLRPAALQRSTPGEWAAADPAWL